MQNIFFITELFYPNKTSTAYIMTEIARYFIPSKNVSVICSSAAYDSNVSAGDDSEINKINMILCDTPKVNKNRSSSRILGAIRVSLSFTVKILKHVTKNDTVFGVTNPFLLVTILAILRKIIRFKYILLVHDVFPENAVPAGVLRKNSLFYALVKKVYDWSYAQADELIVLGRDMQKLVVSKSRKPHNVHIVENWFDSDLVYNPNINRNEYLGVNLDDKIVIGFAGNIGRVQNILDFVKIFKKVNNHKLVLLLIGEGAESPQIEEFVLNNDIKNVLILGSKKRSEQSNFLNCFDIGLISLASHMYGLGVPSKSYNLLYLGKPILFVGDKFSEIDLLVSQKSVGMSFTWNEEGKIVEYLNSLIEINSKFSDNARKLAIEEYSVSTVLSKLNKII
jgi:glycosyltransferase involved in cell wall biosynthesis